MGSKQERTVPTPRQRFPSTVPPTPAEEQAAGSAGRRPRPARPAGSPRLASCRSRSPGSWKPAAAPPMPASGTCLGGGGLPRGRLAGQSEPSGARALDERRSERLAEHAAVQRELVRASVSARSLRRMARSRGCSRVSPEPCPFRAMGTDVVVGGDSAPRRGDPAALRRLGRRLLPLPARERAQPRERRSGDRPARLEALRLGRARRARGSCGHRRPGRPHGRRRNRGRRLRP